MTVEGGAAGLGIQANFGRASIGASAGGGYVGANVGDLPAASWLSIYGNVNGFADVGASGQAGVGVRLGPADWLARPVLRAGGYFADASAGTGGIGLYVGRRGGGVFSADFGSVRGVSFAVVHLGGYFTFGGQD